MSFQSSACSAGSETGTEKPNSETQLLGGFFGPSLFQASLNLLKVCVSESLASTHVLSTYPAEVGPVAHQNCFWNQKAQGSSLPSLQVEYHPPTPLKGTAEADCPVLASPGTTLWCWVQ